MEILNHSVEWSQGEIYEGKWIISFGCILVAVALFIHFDSISEAAKTLLIPCIVLAVLFIGTGVYLVTQNTNRILIYEEVQKEQVPAFVKGEKERVSAFISWYPKTRIILAILAVFGLAFVLFSKNHMLSSIGIALVALALSGYVIDYFSEDRAKVYFEALMRY